MLKESCIEPGSLRSYLFTSTDGFKANAFDIVCRSEIDVLGHFSAKRFEVRSGAATENIDAKDAARKSGAIAHADEIACDDVKPSMNRCGNGTQGENEYRGQYRAPSE